MFITCRVPDRTTRMNAGMVAMPIAIIAVVTELPNLAANTNASSSAGNASSRSVARIRNSEAPGRTMPATMPSGVPITAAMPTATMPTYSVVLAPSISRLAMSRPRMSVPRK